MDPKQTNKINKWRMAPDQTLTQVKQQTVVHLNNVGLGRLVGLGPMLVGPARRFTSGTVLIPNRCVPRGNHAPTIVSPFDFDVMR